MVDIHKFHFLGNEIPNPKFINNNQNENNNNNNENIICIDVDRCEAGFDILSVYQNEIIANLFDSEIRNSPLHENYLVDVQKNIKPRMRATVIDWLVEVAKDFRLQDRTLYLSVKYFDNYLDRKVCELEKLQLLGAVCLWIASKFEEVIPVNYDHFVYIGDNSFTKEELKNWERDVLQTIKWEMTPATYQDFLNLIFAYLYTFTPQSRKKTTTSTTAAAAAAAADAAQMITRKEEEKQITCHYYHYHYYHSHSQQQHHNQISILEYQKLVHKSKYLCELSLLNHKLSTQFRPSTLAVCSTLLCAEKNSESQRKLIELLEQGRFPMSKSNIQNCTKILLCILKNDKRSAFKAIINKYNHLPK